MIGFAVFVLFIAAIFVFARLSNVRRRMELLDQNVIWLRREVEAIRELLAEQPAQTFAEVPGAETPTRVEEPPSEHAGVVPPSPTEAVPPVQGPVAPPAPETEPLPAAAFEAAAGAPPASASAASADYAPPPSETTPAPAPSSTPSRPFDWESLVGVKLFSWIAGIALVLAALFFLRYSVEQGWFSPAVRATIGMITGIALVIVCEMRVARNYSWTANAMHGAGIAILYSTLFAMHAMWHLAPPAVVFFLMLVVTAVAVMLSIRRDSVFIALLGLMGGFATPALLSTGENRPIGLFSYLLLLNAGLAWVAFRKGWPALTLGSLAFTVLYQWGWIATFLTSSQFPLAAGIFVVFAIVGTSAMWTRDAAGKRGSFRRIAVAGAIVPLAFALFGSAVPAYGARYNVLFTFLLLMTSGLAAIAIVRGPEWLHVLGGVATVMTFVIWSGASYRHDAWPAILVWLTVFVVLYLGTALIRNRPDQPPQIFGATIDRGALVAGLLFFLFPVLAAREPSTAWPGILFGTMFVLLLLTGAFVVVRENWPTWLTAACFAIVAEGVWSAKYLTPGTLWPALLTYIVAALIFLAVPVVARNFANAAHLALTSHLFLILVAARPDLSVPPWPLFAALAVIDLAIGIAALYLKRGSLIILAALESQVVLMIWASVAKVSPWPTVALVATLVVAAWTLTWFVLGRRASLDSFELLGASTVGLLLGNIVAMIAGARGGQSLFGPLLATHTALLAALLVLAWLTESHVLAIAGAAFAAMASVAAPTSSPTREFTFAAVLYALFIAYPLLLGGRAKKALKPYLGAVFASVVFFLFARDAMMRGGLEWMIGFLPAGQSLLMIALLVRILRFEAPEARQITRLAIVAGAALAFITVAIPLQLDNEWITLGWALEAAALVWLFERIPHRGLLAWSGALFGAVFVRLVFNPAVFGYHPVAHTAIFNWYLYAYLLAAAAFFAGTYFWPRDVQGGKELTASGGTILLFVLLNIEIADFYSTGSALTFNFFSSSLAEDLTYTIGWAVFAIAMLIAGIVVGQRGARVAAILLLVVTILKCFLHDLARLGGLYRVGSLLGLAASLVIVGLLLQRFVMSRPEKAAA